MHIRVRNVNEAFRRLVSDIHDGTLPTRMSSSRYGNVLVVDEPLIVAYEKPWECVLLNQARDTNPFSLMYEALWCLAGRNDVAPLAYYTKRMTEFSDDGKTLNGAYGYRWRHQLKVAEERTSVGCDGDGLEREYDNVDQLKVIIDHLKAKPDSRRAVLAMWNVEDDLLKIGGKCQARGCRGGRVFSPPGHGFVTDLDGEHSFECKRCGGTGQDSGSRDVCCNLDVVFQLRDVVSDGDIPPHPDWKVTQRFLDITVFNRSNDLIWGLLGANAVQFAFLQSYVAGHLGVEIGNYNQVTCNAHAYVNNWEPERWLEDKTTYGMGHQFSWPTTFPLVSDPKVFDKELPLVVDHFNGGVHRPNFQIDELTEPFLREVAAPVLRVFELHKTYRETETALRMCQLIEAEDWRLAATGWIERRLTKRKEKSNV